MSTGRRFIFVAVSDRDAEQRYQAALKAIERVAYDPTVTSATLQRNLNSLRQHIDNYLAELQNSIVGEL